jgi:hypothetical protein
MTSVSDIAQGYYVAMGNKNAKDLEKYLHPDIELIAPMGEITGKERVFDAAKNFMNIFDSLEIRQTFENNTNSVMIVFDFFCPSPVGKCRTAAMVCVKNNLIARLEIFYDSEPLRDRKKEIFSS